MTSTRPVLLILLLLSAVNLAAYNFFSPIQREATIDLTTQREAIRLEHRNIIVGSDSLFVMNPQDSTNVTFRRNTDYTLDFQNGILSILKLPEGVRFLTLSYRIYPEALRERFYYYTLQRGDSTAVPPMRKRKTWDLGTRTDLNITGSKSISLTVGSQDDVSIDQSLFVKMDGELSPGMKVQAQLSDNSSPITPEGDSREISNLDQVFIKLYGNNYEVAFGDLDFPIEDTQFMNVDLQFEGLRAGWYGKNTFRGALAVSRAQTQTVEFNGEQAKQGPYYLNTDGFTIQVVSGSETVYLNGVSMQRGSDYTIDYEEGTITFTNNHFIDDESYIMVVYQYSDEDYRKNLYMASTETKPVGRFYLDAHAIVQNDDKSNPLQESLSDEDKAILRAAGDNIAWGNGITETEVGNGNYILITEGDESYYEYVGYDSTGTYVLSFSYVGSGEGSYEQQSPSVYYYVGEGQGRYEPVRKLASPQRQINYDFAAGWRGDFLKLETETLVTTLDKNTWSSKDDSDNDSWATHAGFEIDPGFELLQPRLIGYYRYFRKGLEPLAEIDNPESSYQTYEFARNDTVSRTEFFGNYTMRLFDLFTPSVTYTEKEYKDYAAFRQSIYTGTLDQFSLIPYIYLRYMNSDQDYLDPSLEQDFASIRRLNLNSYYIIRNYKFGGEYYHNQFDEKYRSEADYRDQNLTWKVYTGTHDTRQVAAQVSYSRDEYRIDTSDYEQDTDTWQLDYLMNYSRHRLKLRYLHRIVDNMGDEDNYDVAEITSVSNFLRDAISLNLNYSLQNLEFYPKVRELEYIGEGLGEYDSTGVYVEEGDFDWVYITSGESELSIEVTTDGSLFLNPKSLLPDTPILNRLQSESYVAITENSRSKDKWKVYLLSSDRVMDSKYTIYGQNSFRQTLWYDLIPKTLLFKGQYGKDMSLDNRYQETSDYMEESWFYSARYTKIKNNDVEVSWENLIEEDSYYDSRTESDIYTLEITTRTSRNLLLQTELSYTTEDGNKRLSDNQYSIKSMGLSESLTLYLLSKYRVFSKISYKHNDRSGSDYLVYLADKREGDIFEWSLNLSYKVNQFTSASFQYSGDSYPDDETTHEMTLEIRAEF